MSAKSLNRQLKLRGLQKLKYYCQVCEKQCRDDNGFAAHTRSPSHLRRIANVDSRTVDEFSSAFEDSFVRALMSAHGEKAVGANRFYNEFIRDRDHVHMNATRWKSLRAFIEHLSTTGRVRVAGEDELTIAAIASPTPVSSEALRRRETVDNATTETIAKRELLVMEMNSARTAESLKELENSSDEEEPSSHETNPTIQTQAPTTSLKLKRVVKRVVKRPTRAHQRPRFK